MDTIANLLTTLLNAQKVGKERAAVPASKSVERVLAVLKSRGRIADMRLQEGVQGKFIVTLKYEDNPSTALRVKPAIRGVRRISKPGGHWHVSKGKLPYPGHGEGFYVVSTSRGVMDEKQARKAGLGGELMCEIW